MRAHARQRRISAAERRVGSLSPTAASAASQEAVCAPSNMLSIEATAAAARPSCTAVAAAPAAAAAALIAALAVAAAAAAATLKPRFLASGVSEARCEPCVPSAGVVGAAPCAPLRDPASAAPAPPSAGAARPA